MAIFNPLFSSESGDLNLSSESRVINDKAGICPKCQSKMTTASISSGDEVYFCDSCCVAAPLPDNN